MLSPQKWNDNYVKMLAVLAKAVVVLILQYLINMLWALSLHSSMSVITHYSSLKIIELEIGSKL